MVMLLNRTKKGCYNYRGFATESATVEGGSYCNFAFKTGLSNSRKIFKYLMAPGFFFDEIR